MLAHLKKRISSINPHPNHPPPWFSFTAFEFDAIQDLILVLKDMGKGSPKDKLLSGRIQ